ncbi:hypothetical protein [Pseudomonas cichorii]|uniref:Uncharacterized protein n=1 Tax=Pseudomonas cichorii TaxID=36746 RepID=A0ABQ1DT41_PSECI|nr:hypothetical protein [Pseudomonas cichorii]AHF66012.1 hypothetical protein PCH70_08590 [Pseudomonas cichorii JBC1]QVE17978.1 hypothetical protein KGD89_04255 [Pseudomonas cichorii]GFM94169.1 hypothetical protein PSCICP_41410 [Pseudomonas cichorii]SDP00358.1 hypothetical protein SAMN05216599_116132 [Pseudomonas cichorii]
MKVQNGALAPTGSACLKKANELFFVVHPKVPKPLLGPFLTAADAECGRVVIRSAGAVVESRPAAWIDDTTHWHAVNNGQVCRVFAGVAHE